MELKLNEKEFKQIILEWAIERYGDNTFAAVKMSADYGSLQTCTLYKKEPPEEGGKN